mgnify:CR=1 FL=1
MIARSTATEPVQHVARPPAAIDAPLLGIAEHDALSQAERAVEARIRQRPLAHLPQRLVEQLGPEPALQRERSAWTTAATAVAIHRHRYGITDDLNTATNGAASLLGDRPTDPVGAGSWDYAADKVDALDGEIDVGSGVEL